jgi:hypothetical protein
LIAALETETPSELEQPDKTAGQAVEGCDGQRAVAKLPGCD